MSSRSLVLKRYVHRQARLLFKLVGIPLLCAALLAPILVYVIGGTDLLRFAASELFTWAGVRSVVNVVLVLTFVTWVRHVTWYSDEPPPMWFRPSIWLNLLELSILIALIVLAFWAVPRFAAPR